MGKVLETRSRLHLESHLWVNVWTLCLRGEQESERKRAKIHRTRICVCMYWRNILNSKRTVWCRERDTYLGIWYNDKPLTVQTYIQPFSLRYPQAFLTVRSSPTTIVILHTGEYIHFSTHSAGGRSINNYNEPWRDSQAHGQRWHHEC